MRRRRWCVLAAATAIVAAAISGSCRAGEWLSGQALDQALAKPVGIAWAGISRREALGRISEARHIAILLDRRIDPSAEVSHESAGLTLREALQSLVPEQDAVRVLGDAVYLGPRSAVRRLRTAASLRDGEIRQTAASTDRQLDLGRRQTVVWDDLVTPADVLRQIGEAWDLGITGLDKVPHDLWAGATLPNVTAAEALSLVLVQFDLTFSWTADGRGVRLAALPDVVTVEIRHRAPPGIEPEAAARRWAEAFPGIETRIQGRDIFVAGTLEDHDGIDEFLRPAKTETTRPDKLPPLGRVRLTLRWNNPVRKLFETLTQASNTKLTFEFDEAALKAAGIDLDQRIRFEVKNATVEELLHQALDPLEIEFTIANRTVTLSPK